MRESSKVAELIDLHKAFWARELARPIINIDCSLWMRTRNDPVLPREWEDRPPFLLQPSMLSPEKFQQEPFRPEGKDVICGKVAFNTLSPFLRAPWLVGISGCGVMVNPGPQTVWPVSYLPNDWYRCENQGFKPHLDWLNKLLEFVQYIVDRFYPDRCIPAPDLICRGIGDLCVHAFDADRFYLEIVDHPDELKLLLRQITDVYLRWNQAQMDVIPRFERGYCNQYGIWCPGTCIRFQEDYAMNISHAMFNEFLLPGLQRVITTFEYQTLHTHSGCPQLAEWMLDAPGLKCIEVSIDPNGPDIEHSIPLWNRILNNMCLVITGPVTRQQLDLMVSRLSPQGLLLDVTLVTDAEMEAAFNWGKANTKGDT